MPKNSESLNRNLFELLHTRGYDPTMLDTSGKEIPTPEEAEVFQFDFVKDGENYGKVTISIDGAHKLIIYFNDKVADSEKEDSGEGDVSWYKLLNQLKRFAQSYQLSFELRNVNNLKHDMAKRDYMKKKESIAEGYYPMGKKASYSDAVPSVKIVLQHSRQIEEGEQRYRNIAKIFLENEQGERFLAPTTKPGIARVYARHIAEGGQPHDERWNHINSLCEEYQKMGAFVRATRGGQFNESVQRLVTEGVNHYQSLRESLSKLAGHRGYNAYFESYTPALMEDEESVDLSEMFMSSSLDPRIESAMPILAKLSKNLREMSEVGALAEWADSLLEAPGAETLSHNQSTEKQNLKAFGLAEEDEAEQELAIDELDEGSGGGEASEEPVEPIVSEEESLTSNNPQGIPESIADDYEDMSDRELMRHARMLGLEKDIVPDDEGGLANRNKLIWLLQQEAEGELDEEGKGLWANIHAKRERIKHGSGEKMRKPGSKGAPTAQNFKDAAKEGVEMDEGVMDTLKKVGGKVLDKLGHGSDEDLLRDLKKKAGVRNPENAKPSMAHSDVEKVDEDEFAGDYKTGPAGQWRNKGPKANKPAKVGDLVGASESVESKADVLEGQEDLNAIKRLLGK